MRLRVQMPAKRDKTLYVVTPMPKGGCITLQGWWLIHLIRNGAWCHFNSPSCTYLDITTGSDWETVFRSSVMFETALANAYLANDVKRLHVWAHARIGKAMQGRKKHLNIFYFYLIDNLIMSSQGDTRNNDYVFPWCQFFVCCSKFSHS